MTPESKYYIVEAAVLPEIFQKVAETKRLIQMGEADSVQDAVRMSGISRSAYYKYRDSILPFQDFLSGRIVTFQMTLRDNPGVLSVLLTIFAQWGANILTINQNIPTNGCAVVTITAQTERLSDSLDSLLHALREPQGVLKAEILAG